MMTKQELNKRIKELTKKMISTCDQAEKNAFWLERETLKKQLRK